MKIDPRIQIPADSQTEGVGPQRKTTGPVSSSNAAGLAPASGEDTFSLSGAHADIQNLTNAIANVPDVRTDRVSALQQRVQAGQYQPDNGRIADALLAEQSSFKFRT